jgi:hypothetical protein
MSKAKIVLPLAGLVAVALFYIFFGDEAPVTEEPKVAKGPEISDRSIASAQRPNSLGAVRQSPQVSKPTAIKTRAASFVSELTENGNSAITLDSGNTYAIRLNSSREENGIQQLYTTVDPNGRPGFGLITLRGGSIVGTLNTPEGVFEIFGTQKNFRVVRAIDVDGPRRLGADYMARERGVQLPIDASSKQIQIR